MPHISKDDVKFVPFKQEKKRQTEKGGEVIIPGSRGDFDKTFECIKKVYGETSDVTQAWREWEKRIPKNDNVDEYVNR